MRISRESTLEGADGFHWKQRQFLAKFTSERVRGSLPTGTSSVGHATNEIKSSSVSTLTSPDSQETTDHAASRKQFDHRPRGIWCQRRANGARHDRRRAIYIRRAALQCLQSVESEFTRSSSDTRKGCIETRSVLGGVHGHT